MSVLRKYKLHKLGFKTDKKTLEIIKFLKKRLSKLKEFRISVYPDIIFFVRKNPIKSDYLLHYHINSKTINVNFTTIWLPLRDEYKLNIDDIKSVIMDFIKEKYNIEVNDVGII